MGFGPEVLIPLALGAATTAAGTVMTSNANKQAGQDAVNQADVRNKQLQDYRDRMKLIQGETQGNAAKTIDQYSEANTKDRTAAATSELEGQFNNAIAPPAQTVNTASAPATAGANPSVVEQSRGVAAERNKVASGNLAKSMAALGGIGGGMMNSGQKLGHAASFTDMYSNFGKQETALLPQYQDFASTYYKLKPKPSSPGGEALTGLGKTMMSAAGSSFKGFG